MAHQRRSSRNEEPHARGPRVARRRYARPVLGIVAVGIAMVGAFAWASFGRSTSEPPSGAQRHELAVGLDSAQVSQGAAVYAANCAACHGAKGEGEPNWRTSNPDGTYPAPPHDSSGHTWHHSDRLLLEIIRDGGGRFESGTFRSRMPAFAGCLTEEEMNAVLAYLKSLWGPEERARQSEVSARDR